MARGATGNVAAVTRSHRRPSPRSGAAAAAVAVLLVLGVLSGCSASGGDSAKGTRPKSATASQGTPTGAAGRAVCGEIEPGVVVDRTQAVVYFDTQSVCPGWVTVAQGTQVTFTNDGSAPATVVVTATQLPDSAEVARFTIPAGASQPLDTPDMGMMGFSTDALPGFRGTIEVVGPNGETQH